MPNSFFRKQIFLPLDHGSWVFIFSPLLIGSFAGGSLSLASFYLVLGAITAFFIRQPITIAVKAYSGRRPRSDLPAANFWILVYGILTLLALTGLISSGFGYTLILAIPGLLLFAWHLWLVSNREERRQVNVEILATGVLALAAPVAFWVGIVYAYMRLGQREWAEVPPRAEMWNAGLRSFLFVSFNAAFSLVLGILAILPRFIFIPYLVQWSETVWGMFHPAIKWKPTRIGIRQLIVSTLWTILFINTWSL